MRYQEAKDYFQRALAEQQTISIPKLKQLMNDLNLTLEPTDSKEVKFLKNEVKKLNRHIRKLQKEGN